MCSSLSRRRRALFRTRPPLYDCNELFVPPSLISCILYCCFRLCTYMLNFFCSFQFFSYILRHKRDNLQKRKKKNRERDEHACAAHSLICTPPSYYTVCCIDENFLNASQLRPKWCHESGTDFFLM